jgi:hypothetical protein
MAVTYNTTKVLEKIIISASVTKDTVSPSTAKYDLNENSIFTKRLACVSIGAVSPGKAIQVFLLQSDGKYDKETLYETGKVPVYIFDGIEVDLKDIF